MKQLTLPFINKKKTTFAELEFQIAVLASEFEALKYAEDKIKDALAALGNEAHRRKERLYWKQVRMRKALGLPHNRALIKTRYDLMSDAAFSSCRGRMLLLRKLGIEPRAPYKDNSVLGCFMLKALGG